ncbi:putative glutathione s- protein [Rosellinia necatrix]|uniref:Putative glutathione s-protein n=1 Tax=Rosellinia necatrix TaxID=77044 RepID=A0A1W2TFJ6_ROSNE|nr:putative glutathione s- protein [Rosellinia necatrix]
MSTTLPKITVFRGFKEGGAFVWSPFVTKLEARLRFGGVAYATAAGSPRQGPKGKIPYVEVTRRGGGEGEGEEEETAVLGDSALIAAALAERGVLADINARLTGAERAHDLALRAMLEDRLAFYQGWERWTQNYYVMRDHVLWALPWPVRVVVGALIHRNMVATLHGQGTGRFSADEIARLRREVWAGFADLALASRSNQQNATSSSSSLPTEERGAPFWILGGPEPTEADTALFGFLVSALLCTAGPGSQADVKSFPVLLEYARRIQEQYFPDYEALPI